MPWHIHSLWSPHPCVKSTWEYIFPGCSNTASILRIFFFPHLSLKYIWPKKTDWKHFFLIFAFQPSQNFSRSRCCDIVRDTRCVINTREVRRGSIMRQRKKLNWNEDWTKKAKQRINKKKKKKGRQSLGQPCKKLWGNYWSADLCYLEPKWGEPYTPTLFSHHMQAPLRDVN